MQATLFSLLEKFPDSLDAIAELLRTDQSLIRLKNDVRNIELNCQFLLNFKMTLGW